MNRPAKDDHVTIPKWLIPVLSLIATGLIGHVVHVQIQLSANTAAIADLKEDAKQLPALAIIVARIDERLEGLIETTDEIKKAIETERRRNGQ